MSRRQGIRHSRTVGKATGAVENVAVGLFRWLATEHTGMGKALEHMPQVGFLDELRAIFMHFLIAVAGAILTAIWVFVLIAYVLPLLFDWLL